MKIIVTGCKGQLGTELLKQLQEGRSELGPIPEKLLNATVIPVDLPELDISNYRMVDEFVRRNRPDIIINCAAYTNVDGCEVHHDDAFKANALGPRNLAQAAEKTGARLVHVSTDYVFSGRENGGIPQDELAGKSPRDLFPQEAADKLQAGIERKIKEPSFDGVELALPGTDGKEHLYRVSLYVFLDRQEQDAAKEAPLPGSVVAKIWNWDPCWTVVWYEDGRYRGAMQRIQIVDPDYAAHLDSLKNAGRKLAKSQHPRISDFYFKARPSASAQTIEVVATDRFGRRYSERITLEKAQ